MRRAPITQPKPTAPPPPDFKTLAECYADAARRGLALYEAATAEPHPTPEPLAWLWKTNPTTKGKKDR